MNGQGNFYDPRLMDPQQFPIAAKMGLGNRRTTSEDKVSDKLAALQFYQLAIPAPKPPKGSFDEAAAAGGKQYSMGKLNVLLATFHHFLRNQDGIRINLKKLALMIFRRTDHRRKLMLLKD